MFYNGTSNLLSAATYVSSYPTFNSNSNAVTTGGQFTIVTSSAFGDQGNANALSNQNLAQFDQGRLTLSPGAAGGTSVALLVNSYGGASGNGAVASQGILLTRQRGNRDGNLSVQPGDQIGYLTFAGYNGTSQYTTRIAGFQAVVDSSYVANATIIPQNFKYSSAGNLAGTAVQYETTLYANGNTVFSTYSTNSALSPSTVFVSSLNAAANATVTGNLSAGNANLGNLATANFFSGDGSLLTNITAGNVSGQVANALVAGTVYTNAQPNITSVGTLTTLSVSGNANLGNLQLNQFEETVYSIGSTSGTITPDFNNGSIQSMTLTGNVTINSLGNAIAGRSMTLIITQDGTGNRTLTSSMKFAGGSKTLSTAASSVDIISVFYDGSTYYSALTKGYA